MVRRDVALGRGGGGGGPGARWPIGGLFSVQLVPAPHDMGHDVMLRWTTNVMSPVPGTTAGCPLTALLR